MDLSDALHDELPDAFVVGSDVELEEAAAGGGELERRAHEHAAPADEDTGEQDHVLLRLRGHRRRTIAGLHAEAIDHSMDRSVNSIERQLEAIRHLLGRRRGRRGTWEDTRDARVVVGGETG